MDWRNHCEPEITRLIKIEVIASGDYQIHDVTHHDSIKHHFSNSDRTNTTPDVHKSEASFVRCCVE